MCVHQIEESSGDDREECQKFKAQKKFFQKKSSYTIIMPNAHIALRIDSNILLHSPEIALQKMSFKIMEKREQLLENMIDGKVQFKVSNGIEQGTLVSYTNTHCTIKVGGQNVKIALKKLVI